jgi:dipeptidyl aminopeptidase/acylaminoacyl peptidase
MVNEMNFLQFLAVLVCTGCLLANPAAGQVTPLRIEDLVATHSFSEFTPVRFSPDGKRLVYAVKDNRRGVINSLEQYARTGVLLSGVGADLFVAQVATGELTNVTGGRGNNWAPAWSPDGRYLAFLSDRDGSGQAKLWISEIATSTIRKASDVNVRASEIEWLTDNSGVLLTALPENLPPTQFAERSSNDVVQDQPDEKVRDSTVVLYRSALTDSPSGTKPGYGAWSLESYLRDLIAVDIHTGKVKRIDHGHRIAAYALSPDGFHVAVTIPKGFEKLGSQQILFDVNVLSLGTGKPKSLASNVRLRHDGASISWAPDGSRLVYQTGGPEATGDCYLAELKGSVPRNITNLASLLSRGASSPLWDASGRNIYFLHENAIWRASPDGETATQVAKIPGHRLIELVSKQGVLFSPDGNRALVVLTYDNELKQSGFWQVDVETGKSLALLQDSQWYAVAGQENNVSVSPDGKLVGFFLEDAQHSQDLWLASPSFRDVYRLTHINPQLDKYQMGAARLIGWNSLDGELLHGALLLPASYEGGRRYALVVCLYGGASLSNSLVQFGFGSCGGMNMQLLATRGYAVLLPDAPQHLGTPMADLAKTVLPGVDKVIELGIADPNRLGVMGHSYGGYSVLSLLVQTKRFKAAMAADGSGNLVSFYGQMNKDASAFGQSVAETGQMLMGGTPWQFRERYIENSPLFYLDRVETPLFMVHGAADTAVSPFLSDEVFVGLRRLGKEVVYAKYQGEGHSPLYWSYANQLDFCSRVIGWFDAHLNGQLANPVVERPGTSRPF